jgi:hypothetical protein
MLATEMSFERVPTTGPRDGRDAKDAAAGSSVMSHFEFVLLRAGASHRRRGDREGSGPQS